jgi:hypothetical protein
MTRQHRLCRQLSHMSFLAQQLLLPPPSPDVIDKIKVQTPTTMLLDHYNRYSSLKGSEDRVHLVSMGAVPTADKVCSCHALMSNALPVKSCIQLCGTGDVLPQVSEHSKCTCKPPGLSAAADGA